MGRAGRSKHAQRTDAPPDSPPSSTTMARHDHRAPTHLRRSDVAHNASVDVPAADSNSPHGAEKVGVLPSRHGLGRDDNQAMANANASAVATSPAPATATATATAAVMNEAGAMHPPMAHRHHGKHARPLQRVRCLKLKTMIHPDLLVPYLYGGDRGSRINRIVMETGCSIDYCPMSPGDQAQSPRSMAYIMNYLVSAESTARLEAGVKMLRAVVEKVEMHLQRKMHSWGAHPHYPRSIEEPSDAMPTEEAYMAPMPPRRVRYASYSMPMIDPDDMEVERRRDVYGAYKAGMSKADVKEESGDLHATVRMDGVIDEEHGGMHENDDDDHMWMADHAMEEEEGYWVPSERHHVRGVMLPHHRGREPAWRYAAPQRHRYRRIDPYAPSRRDYPWNARPSQMSPPSRRSPRFGGKRERHIHEIWHTDDELRQHYTDNPPQMRRGMAAPPFSDEEFEGDRSRSPERGSNETEQTADTNSDRLSDSAFSPRHSYEHYQGAPNMKRIHRPIRRDMHYRKGYLNQRHLYDYSSDEFDEWIEEDRSLHYMPQRQSMTRAMSMDGIRGKRRAVHFSGDNTERNTQASPKNSKRYRLSDPGSPTTDADHLPNQSSSALAERKDSSSEPMEPAPRQSPATVPMSGDAPPTSVQVSAPIPASVEIEEASDETKELNHEALCVGTVTPTKSDDTRTACSDTNPQSPSRTQVCNIVVDARDEDISIAKIDDADGDPIVTVSVSVDTSEEAPTNEEPAGEETRVGDEEPNRNQATESTTTANKHSQTDERHCPEQIEKDPETSTSSDHDINLDDTDEGVSSKATPTCAKTDENENSTTKPAMNAVSFSSPIIDSNRLLTDSLSWNSTVNVELLRFEEKMQARAGKMISAHDDTNELVQLHALCTAMTDLQFAVVASKEFSATEKREVLSTLDQLLDVFSSNVGAQEKILQLSAGLERVLSLALIQESFMAQRPKLEQMDDAHTDPHDEIPVPQLDSEDAEEKFQESRSTIKVEPRQPSMTKDPQGRIPSFVKEFLQQFEAKEDSSAVMRSLHKRLVSELIKSDPYYYVGFKKQQSLGLPTCDFGCRGASAIKWERKLVSQISSRMKWFDSIAYTLAKGTGGKELLNRKKMNSTIRKLHLVALQVHCLVSHLYCMRGRGVCREMDSLQVALNNSYYEKRMNAYKARLKLVLHPQQTGSHSLEELVRDTLEFLPELLLFVDVWGYEYREETKVKKFSVKLPLSFFRSVENATFDYDQDSNKVLQGICDELLNLLYLWNDFKWGESLEVLTLERIVVFERHVKTSILKILDAHASHLVSLWANRLMEEPEQLQRVRLTQPKVYYPESFRTDASCNAPVTLNKVDGKSDAEESSEDEDALAAEFWATADGNTFRSLAETFESRQKTCLKNIAEWDEESVNTNLMKWSEVVDKRLHLRELAAAASQLMRSKQPDTTGGGTPVPEDSNATPELLALASKTQFVTKEAADVAEKIALHTAAHQLNIERKDANPMNTAASFGSMEDEDFDDPESLSEAPGATESPSNDTTRMDDKFAASEEQPSPHMIPELVGILSSTKREVDEILNQRIRSARVRVKLQSQSLLLARQTLDLLHNLAPLT